MAVCTFFGHRDISIDIEPLLKSTLTDLIETKKVVMFYVGHNGNFDIMVTKTLRELKLIYPHINYLTVLAYMPDNNHKELPANTVFPEALENTPKKFAIDNRNRWMVESADYVVTFVKYNFGGAAKFKAIAEKKKKLVINLADYK